MAGRKGTGGRPPKPTAELKLTGEYREDRHGHRKDTQVVTGKPRKPAILKGEAAKTWNRIVGKSPAGVYGEQDIDLLVQYCLACEKFLAAHAADDWDEAFKCIDKTVKLASKIGVGPIERTRLTIDENAKKKDAFETWESKVG